MLHYRADDMQQRQACWAVAVSQMLTAVFALQFSLDLDDGHNAGSAPMLYEYAMHTKTGETAVRLMSKKLYGDFPVIPACFAGAQHGVLTV